MNVIATFRFVICIESATFCFKQWIFLLASHYIINYVPVIIMFTFVYFC